MSFKYIRDVTDEEEKYLSVASDLATLNGTDANPRVVPSAEDYLTATVEEIITAATGKVRPTNDKQRIAALKAADPATLASLDTVLGLVKLEDKP